MAEAVIRRAGVHLLVVVAMVAIAILHTFPLIIHLSDRLPGLGLGDNVAFVWNLWWGRLALAGHESFFSTSSLIAPLGADLALHTHTASQAAIAATLLSGLPVVTAQNVLLLLALVLNGMSMYGLALTIGATRGAACVAGMLFLVSPIVTTRLMGHFNLVPLWPFVLACWAVVRLVRRPSMTGSLPLGVAVGLVAYTDYYLLVFFAVLAFAYVGVTALEVHVHAIRRRSVAGATACWVVAAGAFLVAAIIELTGGGVVMIGPWRVGLVAPTNALAIGWLFAIVGAGFRWRVHAEVRRREMAWKPTLLALTGAALVATVLIAPLIGAGIGAMSRGDYVTQTSSLKSSPRGIDLATVVLGPPFHGIVGPPVRDLYARLNIDVMESSGWMGVVPAMLMLLALRRWEDRDVRRWTLLAAVFLIWALGPFLVLFAANTGLLLPEALARFIPIVNNARIPGRAMLVVAVVGGVLSAKALSARAIRVRGALGIAAVLGLLESLAWPLPLAAVPSSSAYARLATMSDPGAVLPVPFGVRDGLGERGMLDPSAMYFQTIHGRPIAGGFVARLPERVFEWYVAHDPYHTLLRLAEAGKEDAHDAAHDDAHDDDELTVSPMQACAMIKQGLDLASIKYVVVNRALATPAMREYVERLMPLTLLESDQQFDLMAVRDC